MYYLQTLSEDVWDDGSGRDLMEMNGDGGTIEEIHSLQGKTIPVQPGSSGIGVDCDQSNSVGRTALGDGWSWSCRTVSMHNRSNGLVWYVVTRNRA